MTTKSVIFTVSAVALLLFAGCATKPAAVPDATKSTEGQTERLLLQDPLVRDSVTCTALQERLLADGRMEVVVTIKNMKDKHLMLQFSCLFKDEQGMPMNDETPWHTVSLGEYSVESMRFVSFTPQARKYTVRVRLMR